MLSVSFSLLFLASFSVILPVHAVGPPTFTNVNAGDILPVSEAETSGYLIKALVATDPDSDPITYTVNDADGGPFDILVPSSGELKTNGPLDRETKDSYSVVLRASAAGDDTDVAVTIQISDVNDNAPTLTETAVDRTIDEEKDPGFNPGFSFSAADQDTGETLTWELSGADGTHFNIDNLAGTVTMKSKVDVDSTPGTQELVYTPIITVFDNGKTHSASTTLTLTVTDINDNTPSCSNLVHYANLPENSNNGGAAIETLTCTDDDSSLNNNNVLAFTLDPANADFNVLSNGQVKVVNTQDYEAIKSVTLKIKVADTPSTGALDVTATVFVTVGGVNDEDPVWGALSPTPDSAGPPPTYDEGENIAIGTTVFTVTATDADDDVGKDITYSISSVSDGTNTVTGLFTIDPTNGQVATRAALDRDGGISSYILQLEATDGGTGSHVITTSVTMQLTDVNDIAPQFTSLPSTIINIVETSAKANSVIHTFSATDGDVSATTYTYSVGSVVSGNSLASDWKFNAGTAGEFQFAVDFDLDTDDKAYNVIQVFVSDSVNTATASVTVSITPADNEFTPTGGLSQASPISIPESSTPGTVVVTITGNDQDVGTEGELTYEIASGNVNDAFILDTDTRQIKVQKSLDRETLDTYSLVVKIKDKAATSKSMDISLVINLNDVNDNAPSCTQLLIPADVLENSATGYEVASLSCSDADSGSTLTYTVAAPESATFEFDTNKLKLKAPVNYDSATQSYSVTCTVSDGTLSTTVVVSVRVTAVNEDTPSFTALAAIDKTENNNPPNVLTTYTAADNDYPPHAITSYAISAVTNSGANLFAIDATTAEIKIVGVLDYEALPAGDKTYKLTILATDGGGLQDSSTVTVNVIDQNDGIPSCTKASWTVSFNENPSGSGPWTLINALGCTDPEGASLMYSFSQTSPSAAFAVAADAVTLTAVPLDYENAAVHTLTITVSDGTLTTEVKVTVNVVNLNDGAPTFASTTAVDKTETIPVGTTIAVVSATDPDGEDLVFGDPQHSIIGGDTSQQFTIDVDSGVITTRSLLDFEDKQTYSLVIQAQERGGANPVTVTQVVNVLDANDNVPACSPGIIAETVAEDKTASFLVTAFSCSDSDAGTTLTYTLTGATTFFEMSGANLVLKAPLDFETAQSHALTLTVSDGDASHNVVISGSVSVGSVDEGPPSYATVTYNVDLNEAENPGFLVETVAATDPDSNTDANGIVVYSFDSSYPDFAIDSTNGKITLAKKVDRDSSPTTYTLLVKASDVSGSNTATVSVTVKDANDNTPVFNPTSYTGTISESDPSGTTVLTVAATDADDPGTNDFGTVKYSLSGTGSTDFSVHATSGVITSAATMNAGTTPTYSLTVTATDSNGGSGARSSTAPVIINVNLANQNSPAFQSTPYSRTIAENDFSVGDVIYTVTAADSDSGINGVVTLSFSVAQSKFSLSQSGNVGSILLKQALDFESGDTSFNVDVKATDGGTPPRVTTETVTITVNDANDNSPLCTSGLNIDKDEGVTSITTLSCNDADAGTTLAYSVVSTTPNSVTTSVSSSGAVTVAPALDYETATSYVILIKVQDDAAPVKSTTVTINLYVNDLNDNDPSFTGTPFTINLAEDDTPSSTVLLSVTASGNDGPTDTVTYSLSDTTYFDIAAATGDITLKANAPDVEAGGGSTTVNVCADDSANPTARQKCETINVYTSDANDREPIFNPAVYNGQVAENAAAGFSVGKVTATDADLSAAFYTITYSITGGDPGNVWRVQSNGDVEVDGSLDFEATPSYTLVIQASDGKFSPTVNFHIKVTPINEFDPVFSPATDSVNVDENSAPNAAVVTKVATDNDGGDDGSLRYTIDSGPFSIDSTTGAITVSGNLDRDTAPTSYTIKVRAIDAGTSPGPKTGMLVMTFNIQDLNDNTPSCSSNPYTGAIPENAPAGTTVASLTCADDDDDPLNQNNALTYQMVNHATVFQVDSNGVLTVRAGASLDRETTSFYEVFIDVADSATVGTKLTSTATVSVFITDINDNDPVLGTLPTPSHDENLGLGQTVATVAASDLDDGANAEIVYSITGGNTNNIFIIDSVSGVITLAKSLNYEDDTSHTLEVTVSDKGTSPRAASGNVVVTVNNINDTPPVCGTSLYTKDLDENSVSAAVATVTCTDVDGTISYSITAGNTNSDFEINSASGALTTKSSANLNYEDKQSHTLTIQASDGTFAATTTVQVNIKDVNEFAPNFNPAGPYTKSISEAETAGFSVFKLAATDGDASDTVHAFSITGGNTDNRFMVDAISGEVKVLAPLDRETTPSYTLTIEVADVGGLKDSTTLTINLNDENDNDPKCSDTKVGVKADEGVTSGTLYTPSCSDKDTVATPTLGYSITSGTHASLALDPDSGVLSLAGAFDYETATSHSLVITVTDKNTRTTTIDVTITINPVNEFNPVFTAASAGPFNVAEDAGISFSFAKVSATDDDSGSFHGTVRYSIEGGDPSEQFSIDSANGDLKVLRSLDREANPSYTLTIRASDDLVGSPNVKTADINIVINIDDANDVIPTFNPTLYTVEVYENSTFGPLVTLTQFTVSDDDAGVNGQMDISITSGNSEGKFSISGTSLKLVAALDYETTSLYVLVLEVKDRGTQPLKSAARAVIKVQPINEQAPLMSASNGSATIPEDTIVGTLVYDANATDTDSDLHGQITYSIDSGVSGGEFFIDELSGKLYVASALDFDTAPTSYSIVLKATDGGGQTESTSTVALSITLSDVNDNFPQFSNSMFTFPLNENSGATTTCGKVIATDNDVGANGQITLTETGGSGSSFFDIDAASGDVTVAGTIDFEASEVYYLSLTAQDGGSPPKVSKGLVKITVNNMNDNDPVISPSEFAVLVSEAAVVGANVYQFSATDADTSIDAFSLATANSFFEIDPTSGMVKIKNDLDRETTDSHTLSIKVLDKRTGVDTTVRSAVATLTVIVLDINDNNPVITSTYTPSISEAAIVNQLVFKLTATDDDINENGQMVFSIDSGNTGGAFKIDSNGNIQVGAGLDRETTSSYTLTISVTDKGTPPRADQRDITITIDDENDNTPAFQSNPYTLDVNENSNIGDAVGSVLATDPDAGINAQLTYSFDSFTLGTASHFAIDGASGAITVASTALDREIQQTYTANIKVTDAGNPLALSSFTVVNININDVNDNAPVFSEINYSGSVDENSALTFNILQVAATDADIGVNAALTFSIDGASIGDPSTDTHLEIDPSTGIITPKINIDYEAVKNFNFRVIVTDGGTPPLDGTATVTVIVNDVNDNAPIFNPVFYNTEVAYSAVCDNTITTVSATDADSGDNAKISYSLEVATNDFLLNVNADTGEVKLQSVASPNTRYKFTLRATDAGSPVLASGTPATLRMDTFVPNLQALTFRLSISRADFESQRATFITNLQTIVRTVHPGALVRIWCVSEYSGVAQAPNSRRRLLQASQPVDVHIVSLQDDSTDNQANIDNDKQLLTQDQLFALFAADPSGTPGSAIQGGVWTSFNIVSVSQFEEETDGWFDTLNGKIITAVAAVLGLVLLILWLYLVFKVLSLRNGPPKARRRGKVRITEVAQSPTPYDNRPVLFDKTAWDTNKVFPEPPSKNRSPLPDPLERDSTPPPIVNSPPPRSTDDFPRKKSPPRPFLTESSDYGIVNRDFDGRALDPVTGHVYEYNTKTNERRWVN